MTQQLHACDLHVTDIRYSDIVDGPVLSGNSLAASSGGWGYPSCYCGTVRSGFGPASSESARCIPSVPACISKSGISHCKVESLEKYCKYCLRTACFTCLTGSSTCACHLQQLHSS